MGLLGLSASTYEYILLVSAKQWKQQNSLTNWELIENNTIAFGCFYGLFD
jgi:hypothetical protein